MIAELTQHRIAGVDLVAKAQFIELDFSFVGHFTVVMSLLQEFENVLNGLFVSDQLCVLLIRFSGFFLQLDVD